MKQNKIVTLDDPVKTAQLIDCYRKIDYYYDMIEIAEHKRDLLIKDLSLNDIRYACEKSSGK